MRRSRRRNVQEGGEKTRLTACLSNDFSNLWRRHADPYGDVGLQKGHNRGAVGFELLDRPHGQDCVLKRIVMPVYHERGNAQEDRPHRLAEYIGSESARRFQGVNLT